MGTSQLITVSGQPNFTMPPTAVNPSQKLDWCEDHMPERLDEVKEIFIHVVSIPAKAAPSCGWLTNYLTHSFESTGKDQHPQIGQTYLVRRQQVAFLVLGGLAIEQWTHLLNEKWSHTLMTWRKGLELSHIGRWVGINVCINFTATFYLQENHLRYPTIFALAMDILLIQGSSVPCERVFSSAKETMTDHQSHIQPELMEGLPITQVFHQTWMWYQLYHRMFLAGGGGGAREAHDNGWGCTREPEGLPGVPVSH